jgi:hypothetical protein
MWEYMEIWRPLKVDHLKWTIRVKANLVELEELGNEGWEMVSMAIDPNTSTMYAVMKKKVAGRAGTF